MRCCSLSVVARNNSSQPSVFSYQWADGSPPIPFVTVRHTAVYCNKIRKIFFGIVAVSSSLDLERIKDLLQKRQYDGVLFMLEKYQHPALDELHHRALVKPTSDSMFIDTLEINAADTTALISIIRSEYAFERRRHIAKSLVFLAAVAAIVIGTSLLYAGNYYGVVLIVAIPASYLLYRFFKVQATVK
jgi:hypothetical protein